MLASDRLNTRAGGLHVTPARFSPSRKVMAFRIFGKRSAPASRDRRSITVSHTDGRVESVTLAQLNLQQAVAWADCFEFDKRPQMLELCCQKPAGWASTLTLESAGALVQHCYSLHLPRLVSLAAKDVALGARIMPILEAALRSVEISERNGV